MSVAVLDRDLRSCRPEAGSRACTLESRNSRQAAREHAWLRGGSAAGMSTLGVAACVAEHHPLVAGAEVLVSIRVDTHRDVRRLLLHDADHRARGGVKAPERVGVTDLAHRAAHDRRKLQRGGGRDLARQGDQPGLEQRLAGHAARGILLEHGVQDGIGNLVGHLVRMALGYGLGREQHGHTTYSLAGTNVRDRAKSRRLRALRRGSAGAQPDGRGAKPNIMQSPPPRNAPPGMSHAQRAEREGRAPFRGSGARSAQTPRPAQEGGGHPLTVSGRPASARYARSSGTPRSDPL